MMQIKEVVIYGYNKKVRTIPFAIGAVNIIPGDSKTGKSTIEEIINYCFGSRSCNISEGVVRDNVEWFGLLLQMDDEERVFIARKNPGPNKQSTNACFVKVGKGLSTPRYDELTDMMSSEDFVAFISGKLGIGDNLAYLNESANRPALEANIRHALLYCIQGQSEIAIKTFLFHKQSDSFVAQSIKDTFPYFSGAYNYSDVQMMKEKKGIETKIAKLKGELARINSSNNGLVESGKELIEEAVVSGIIEKPVPFPVELHEIIGYITQISLWRPLDQVFQNNDELSSLQNEYRELRVAIRMLDSKIYEIKQYQSCVSDYNDVTNEHRKRLESIHLFDELSFDDHTCPFCHASIDGDNHLLDKMRQSLLDLDVELDGVAAGVTKTRKRLDELLAERKSKKEALDFLGTRIGSIYEQVGELHRNLNDNTKRSQIVGKCQHWLESLPDYDSADSINSEISRYNDRLLEIEKLFGYEARKERMESVFSLLQDYLTSSSVDLDLEYQGIPYRFDLSALTIKAIKPEVSIPLRNLGGGSNWMKCHLMAYFAFQKLFRNKNRPVPSFLFLDQPSQVFFSNLEDLQDTDSIEIKRVYAFIFEQVKAMDGKLQVIVVDHADLKDEDFQSAVVEKWKKNGKKLVPEDWYAN